jgi:hypothetical protein
MNWRTTIYNIEKAEYKKKINTTHKTQGATKNQTSFRLKM